MTPRKLLLLYCADGERRSELSYLLNLHIYRVADLDTVSPPRFALVVHDDETSVWAAKHINDRYPEVPMLVLLPAKTRPSTEAYPAMAQFLKSPPAMEILEWLHVTGRKRGPKKMPSGSVGVDPGMRVVRG